MNSRKSKDKRQKTSFFFEQSGLSTLSPKDGLIIGITGGIGSGKSTIARELARRGFVVYDCDQEAKRIITENQEVQRKIMDLLGEESFVDGIYNTAYVAQRVFAEPNLLERLNAIVHPAVKKDILTKKPDFIESAILYEAGFDAMCNKVVVIDAPEKVRIARTIARDYQGDDSPTNIRKVQARMRAQKIPLGDLSILNDGKTPIPDMVDKITQWMCKN